MFSSVIEKLIKIFSKFPTIGPRTASRFVFYLIKMPKEEFDDFIETLKTLKSSIKLCLFCFNPFENSENNNLCPICRNPSRDKTMLCIVEKENDLISIEKTKKYQGLYFILGGTVSRFKKEDMEKIRINQLLKRIENPEEFGLDKTRFEEIIIATNPTVEGEATALFLERKLSKLRKQGLKITRLGKGLPVGGELEYADEETLKNAFEGRKHLTN